MRLVLLSLCVLVACGSKKREPPPAPPPSEPPPAPGPASPPPTAADALWQLAPPSAVAGIVVADGGLPLLRASWVAVAEIADVDPYTAAIATELRAGLARAAGFDLFDPDFGASADLDRGVAVFFDADGRVILTALPPAIDADAGTAAHLSQALGGVPCQERDRRLVCGAESEGLDPGPLAAIATSLPTDRRGLAELVIDVARVPAFQDARARVAPLVDRLSSVSAAVTLEAGAARVRMLARGTRGDRFGALLRSAAPMPLLDDLMDDSPSAVRLSIDPGVLAISDVPIARDLASVWTGEIGLFARGAGVLSGVIALGVRDEARARTAIGPICNSLLRPLGPIQRLDDRQCRITLALPREAAGAEPIRAKIYAALADTPIVLDVHRGALRARFGNPPEPPPAPSPAAVTAPLHLRASALGPLALAGDEVAEAVDESMSQLPATDRARIAGVRWVLAQLATLELFLDLAADGLRVDVSIVSFASDHAQVYAAYRTSLGSLRRGDRAEFRRGLEQLRRAHPSTHAARQADAVLGGAPVLGPAALVALVAIPALVAYVDAQRTGEPAPNRR